MAKSSKNRVDIVTFQNQIRTGNISEALEELKKKQLEDKNAVECIVEISQHAYNDVQKGIKFNCCVTKMMQLIDHLCSTISNLSSVNVTRYLTSLYHILYFLFTKNHLEPFINLFNKILQMRQNDRKAFDACGKNLLDFFINLLRKAIINEAKRDRTLCGATKLLIQLLKFMTDDGELKNGTLYLQTLLHASQISSEGNENAVVLLITTSLSPFYKTPKIEDNNSSVFVLFKIFRYMFVLQHEISGYRSALRLMNFHVNEVKLKFSVDINVAHCFLLLRNAIKVFLCDSSEEITVKKIQQNNETLKLLEKCSETKLVTFSCVTIMHLFLYLCKTLKKRTLVLPNSYMKPLLEMFLNMNNVLKDCNSEKIELIHCVCDFFEYLSDLGSEEILRNCVTGVVQANTLLLQLLHEIRYSGHEKTDLVTKLVLIRSSNLIRVYHILAKSEDVISVSKPVCHFICNLPSDAFDDPQIKQATECLFACLTSAFGIKQLDKILECIVVWLIKCPQSSVKAFRLWGDFKHNTVCEGRDDFLDTTVWTVITERKSNLNKVWLEFNLTDMEIGNLLVQELKTYFVNKTLRGKPVIAATEALLNLNVDSVTMSKGLVVAMDIASTTDVYADECLKYLTKSKSLVSKLRKSKKVIDQVDYNCCMGDLLYAQLRCELRFLRQDCETEVLRVSSVEHKPLVAELPESRPDPNDTCDAATKYQNLCLANQRKFIDNLDNSLRHWEFAYEMLKVSPDKKCDLRVTLENIQDAGFLVKLYCEKIKEAKVWKLLYNMATVSNDIEMVVCALGQLINSSDEIDEEWITNLEKHVKNPELSVKTKRAFLLSSSLYHLSKNQISRGLALLEGLESDIKKSPIVYVVYLLAIGKYQRLNDWPIYNHNFECSTSYHFSFHKALSHLLYLVEDKKWKSFTDMCQIHLSIFEVSCLLGESNLCLEQPREARCYLKSQFALAQKLGLPLRTVQLLVLLAWVDLNTGMIHDCAVKLEGLEDLLELCGTPLIYDSQLNSPCLKLNKSVLSRPEYLSHPSSCCCLYCANTEYRRLVLETITLRATFCAAFGRVTDALQCFEVAIIVQEDLSGSNNSEVKKSCAQMWLRYGDVMAKNKQFKEGLEANRKALELLASVPDPNLYQRAMDQKFSLVNWSCHYKPIGAIITVERDEKTPSVVGTPKSLKTPQSVLPEKIPLKEIDENVTPVTPFARPVRTFKLPLSDEENKSPISTMKKKSKTAPKLILDTPQTAAISRTPFIVYTDNGNAVNVPSSKTSKIKTTTAGKMKEKGSNKPSKKKLFSTDQCSSDVELLPEIPVDKLDDVIRKSNRKNDIKTYSKSKNNTKINGTSITNSAGTASSETATFKGITNNDVFKFDDLKKIVNEVVANSSSQSVLSAVPSSLASTNKNSKARSFSQPTRRNNKSKLYKTTNDDHNSDSDIIEGTPPEHSEKKFTTKPRRATRSSKV